MSKTYYAITKQTEGYPEYLTCRNYEFSWTKNQNFAYVFKSESEAYEYWNNLTDIPVKNFLGVQVKSL
jgi:hypothetical protein